MKWWFKPILVILVVTELASGVFFGLKIYYWERQTQVLGTSVSVIHKSLNPRNPQSSLKYYYEPAASKTEIDTTSWLKEKIVWTYNSDTLNSLREYTPNKPPKTYRIIALGDSHTFGDHVTTGDAWPAKLEGLLNAKKICGNYDAYEVINLGVRGYDIQDEVERFRLRGQKYHPDLVIWFLIGNDFDEINELIRPLQNKSYDILVKENKLNPDPYRVSDEQVKDEFLLTYSQNALFAIEGKYVNQFFQMYEGSLLVINYPFLDLQDKNQMHRWLQGRMNTWYFDGLPNISYNPAWEFHPPGIFDGHPTAVAHQLIAQTLYQYLQKNSLISCK